MTAAIDIGEPDRLAFLFGAVAVDAGAAVMGFFRRDADVRTKQDGSPVTQADLAAETLIRHRLSALFPGLVIVGEESCERIDSVPDVFFLVDPLDGTREFIAGREDFTINIALVKAGLPFAGCVYAPALHRLYLGGARAFRAMVNPGMPLPPDAQLEEIRTRPYPASGLRAVASRSHRDPRTEAFLKTLTLDSCREVGSSLKFCLIAEGEADVYPRLARTREWDIAAGHAVLAAAGGRIAGQDGQPLRYGNVGGDFLSGDFVAWGRPSLGAW
ncbi:MAG: 3'(2'),5'-bisphosphate nucleotidase CysQ [Pseudorhodoplanes sp.]